MKKKTTTVRIFSEDYVALVNLKLELFRKEGKKYSLTRIVRHLIDCYHENEQK